MRMGMVQSGGFPVSMGCCGCLRNYHTHNDDEQVEIFSVKVVLDTYSGFYRFRTLLYSLLAWHDSLLKRRTATGQTVPASI